MPLGARQVAICSEVTNRGSPFDRFDLASSSISCLKLNQHGQWEFSMDRLRYIFGGNVAIEAVTRTFPTSPYFKHSIMIVNYLQ